MTEKEIIAILAGACGILFVWAITTYNDYRQAAKRLERLQFCNKHAHLLGKTVEAKVYEGSNWERMVVVAVSWRGAVAVRPVWDLHAKSRWIQKHLVPQRVREVRRNGQA